MSRFNGADGLPKSSDGLSALNYGIDRANPTSSRDGMSAGGPEMVALKMVVDGALVVLEVSSVMDEAWGRSAADLGNPTSRCHER
jgi:hypothetical protein